MKLIRLRLAHFGCVRSADIHFGERLNVLYGRNDLGKSSLVAAIRAALFLQHDSSVHRPYVTWQTNEQPQIELTLQTEPQRFYRIKKSFGSKGRSILEESRDGKIYLNPIKGRQVDGIIRSKLLPWGIPEPGGKRRERSMPSSFLSAALLAEQTDVTALFDRQLGADDDESGKQLLSDALQATARDPLFTNIVHAAQAKVDEAFTATGRRKRGRTSPFHQLAQDISSTKNSLDEMRLEAESGARIRAQLAELDSRLLSRHEAAEEAARVLTVAREVVEKRAELHAARAELDRVQGVHDQARTAAQLHEQAAERAETLRARRAACDEEIRAATAALELARDKVVHAKSAASDLHTRIQALDIERADLLRRLDKAEQRKQAAEQTGRAHRLCDDLAAKIAEHERDDRAMLARIHDREELAELESDLHVLNGVALLVRWRDADEKLAASYDVAVELAVLMTEIEDARNEADALEAELLERELPDHETMAHLRELDAQLRVAEGGLSVGLSAIVESALGLRLEVVRDDGEAESLGDVRGQVEVGAERELTLILPNLATIRISGGNDMNRARVKRSRDRWDREAIPLLQAAEVESLAELDDLLDEYSKDVHRLRELREQDEKGWEKGEMLRQRLIDAEPLRTLRAELDEQLDRYDRDHISDRIDMLEDELEDSEHSDLTSMIKSEMDSLEWDIEALRQRVRKGEVAAAEDKARVDGWRARLTEAQAERDLLSEELDRPWRDILATAEDTIADCQAKLHTLDSERERVRADSGEALEMAAAAVARAERELATGRTASEQVNEQYERAREELTRLEYERGHKKELADGADIDQCKARVDGLTAALAALQDKLPEDADTGAGEAFLRAQEDRVERARREVRDIEREREQALGALRETGGERLREKVHDLEGHYRRLEQAQVDLEFDYDAWHLLLDTLREVEREQAAHLGRAMVEPITARFRELTASRYGALELGPNLETQGIYASGERRDIAELSLGTKEQLSTLFRLSLAETLGSAVLLDDQLTQTDPERMGWFRTQMRKLSEDIQIIVFTCRVQDYLGERAPLLAGESVSDMDSVRAIRLDDLIDRV